MQQWDSDVDDRYAITLVQNCPASLLDSFTFDLSFANQSGSLVTDTSTPANEVAVDGVSNIVLKNAKDDTDNFFGVILNATYGDAATALGTITYSYTA